MTVRPLQRPFTAELRKRASELSSSGTLLAENDTFAAWQHEMLSAIHDICKRLSGLDVPQELKRLTSGRTAAVSAAEDCGSGETNELKLELQALEHAIVETKREIAALRQLGKPPASLATATNELDAVVHATEGATECILAASERIDELLSRLHNQAANAEERTIVDEIGEQVTRIFESCNFQDITGQRINKVVGAMKFIEQRVERMIEILGGANAFAGLDPIAPPSPENAAEDESHLLCGPQLEGAAKISQDDIDAFFS